MKKTAKNTRNTSLPQPEITPAQFEEAMSRYAAAGLRGIEINKAIEAEMSEVTARYADELHCIEQVRHTAWDTIRQYCSHNKQRLFAKSRSIGTPFGIVGFRLGTPRLKSPGDGNWNTVVQTLKEQLPEYVRTIEEPAKDRLLADRHKQHVAPLLQQMGVRVVQDDLFYIDETGKAA